MSSQVYKIKHKDSFIYWRYYSSDIWCKLNDDQHGAVITSRVQVLLRAGAPVCRQK